MINPQYYTEGSSLMGYLVKDYVLVGDEIQESYENSTLDKEKSFIEKERVKFVFGCTIRETNLFFGQKADGIIGLGVNTNCNISP